jgi:hypothetical protein
MMSHLFAAALHLFAHAGQDEPIDLARAARYFQEARWVSDDDGGKLWGRPLYGPMVFVDPRTRALVANEKPDAEGFVARDGLYTGRLPADFGIANYAFKWGGKRWTMVMWPLPENRAERSTLVMHELYHRIQPDLGHGRASPPNAHLETMDARVWLQLELKALADALAATSAAERDKAAGDALLFRRARQRLAADAKREEDLQELNEGLAQFTGYMLRGGWEPESRQWLAGQLRQAMGLDSYSRRFAYSTGAAYAFLLNLSDAARFGEVRWRRGLAADSSLADKLAEGMGAAAERSEEELEAVAGRYGAAELRTSEEARERARREKAATIRARLIDGPVLVLPLAHMRNAFRNEHIFAMGAEGTYFEASTLIDDWGTLEVASGGLLLAADRKTARVAAPSAADGTSGPGWKLTLAPGWKSAAGTRAGDFTLTRP